MFQVYKNVQSVPEQLDHHRVHADVQQRDLPGSGLDSHQRRIVPLHMHGTGVATHGRILPGIRIHVLKDLEGSFHLHRRQAQQKGKPLRSHVCSFYVIQLSTSN